MIEIWVVLFVFLIVFALIGFVIVATGLMQLFWWWTMKSRIKRRG